MKSISYVKGKSVKQRNPIVTATIKAPKRNAGAFNKKLTKYKGSKE